MGFITIPHTFDVDTTVRSFFNDSLEAGSIGVSTENVFLGRVTNIATDTITVRTIGNERLRIVDGDTIFSTNGGSTTTVDGDLTYDTTNRVWTFDVDTGANLNVNQGLWLRSNISDQTISTNTALGVPAIGYPIRFDKGTRITTSGGVIGVFI